MVLEQEADSLSKASNLTLGLVPPIQLAAFLSKLMLRVRFAFPSFRTTRLSLVSRKLTQAPVFLAPGLELSWQVEMLANPPPKLMKVAIMVMLTTL